MGRRLTIPIIIRTLRLSSHSINFPISTRCGMGACILHSRCSWPLLRSKQGGAGDALQLGQGGHRWRAAASDQVGGSSAFSHAWAAMRQRSIRQLCRPRMQ